MWTLSTTTPHPKLWPLAYYNNLISCIRKDYPELAIVQVGASEQFGIFDDTDLNLVGRTTLEETIVVLKYSLCHIDTEGGLVHIKRFLNGQSIVVFGPTLPSLYGYKENYNLRSDACPSSCEWVTRHWTEGCMRGYAVAPCMEAMAPHIVYQTFLRFMSTVRQTQYLVSFRKSDFDEAFTGKSKKIAQLLRDNELIDIGVAGANPLTIYDEDLGVPDEFGSKNCDYLRKARILNVDVEYGTPYNIPSDSEAFDVVYSGRLEEVEERTFALRELLRIVKNGGLVCLKLPPHDAEQLVRELDLDAQPSFDESRATLVIRKEKSV